MRIVIKNGTVIDPGVTNGVRDVLIEDDRIVGIYAPGAVPDPVGVDPTAETTRIIDAAGLWVTPGLIDLHVHLREPGHAYKETIVSGARAAAAGGITAVCAMPNTHPVNDNAETTRFILEQAQTARAARVYPVAAISKGLKGDQLTAFSELKAAGAVALSDDGCPVNHVAMMRQAMETARRLDLLVMPHCEVPALVGAGVMNDGPTARTLGYAGIPNAAESIMVMRDIALCELTGCRLHIAHVSTTQSVRAIRQAKAQGLPVTAETAPHYFTLTDSDVARYGTHAKMNPPLRSEADRLAIVEGLADGTLDAIATDHAPHSSLEKKVAFDAAANGIIGLESALPVSLKLVHEGHIDMETLVRAMSLNPARILGRAHGVRAGLIADITIIDPLRQHTIDVDRFVSLSRNCPFHGWPVKGAAVMTIVNGRVVYEAT
ncbi:MAG: dihydroorotase [Pseudomonadota bacterium]